MHKYFAFENYEADINMRKIYGKHATNIKNKDCTAETV